MYMTNPLALSWAGLAVPLVILYLLKIRMRRVPVSTVMFWQQVFQEKEPRAIWQRLRHLLSLLLQLAFLIFLVLALADPVFRWEIRRARRVVLIVDNSASMRATDTPPSRLARAKDEAKRVIASLRHRDEMAVVTAGGQPRVVCGLSGHLGTLRQAVEGIAETDGPTRVTQAVGLARRLLAGHPRGQIVLLSDGCFPAATELAASADVAWVPIGKRSGNVGITRFQVRRSLVDPVGYQVLIEVSNCSEEAVDLRLELELDSQIVDVIPIQLEPEGTWSRVLEKTAAEGGRLQARLDRPDPLAADNVAWAILPPRRRQPVILVTQGNVFLERVFQAQPMVDLTVASRPPADPPGDAVLVLHRSVPNPVPRGRVLVLQPANSTDLWELGEPLQDPIVAKQKTDSPLMAHVRLERVLMPEACQVTWKPTPEVLAQTATDDPLYAALEEPDRKLLVLTVNLDRGDLPLRTAFPILVTNALNWFAGSRGELRPALATGSVTRIALPASTDGQQASGPGPPAGLALRSPDGRSLPLGPRRPSLTIGPLDRCGIWQIGAGGGEPEGQPALVEVASNLASRRESDLRTPEHSEPAAAPVAAGLALRPLWFYLLALAWLWTGVEWFLYQRRWIS